MENRLPGRGNQDNLGKKASQGAVLVTLSYAFEKFTRIASLVVLARLLAPHDFGLVALAMLVINALTIFNDFGLAAAVVYKKERIDLVADTALVLTLLFGAGMAALSFLLAPVAAAYFQNSDVTAVLQVLSLLIAIKAFGSIPSALLQKELNFKRKIIPEIARSFIYAVLAISLAYLGWGVWSIVIGELGSSIIGLVLVWLIAGWRPRFRFDIEVAREIMGYGKHVVLSSVFLFAAANIDYAIVGKMLGTTALGLYTIAFKLATYPSDTLRLVSRVIFPTFSKLEHEKERLGRVFLKSLNYVSFLIVPAGLIILLTTPSLIEVVIGKKWLGASQATQALVLFGIAKVLLGNTAELFRATGRPDLQMKLEAAKLSLLAPLLYFLTPYGILAVGIVQSALMLAFVPLYVRLATRILDIRVGEFARALRPTVVGCAVMAACTVIAQHAVEISGVQFSVTLLLGGSLGIALLSYVVTALVIDKQVLLDIVGVLRSGLRTKVIAPAGRARSREAS